MSTLTNLRDRADELRGDRPIGFCTDATTGPTLVQLINGEWVHSDAEAWRNECLARYVMALATLTERRAWLADFEKRHGADETERLKYQMLQQQKERR